MSDEIFPNAPGLSEKLRLELRTELPPEVIGWGPWKRRWGSICSRHHRGKVGCEICLVGRYDNVWRSEMAKVIYRISPGLWRWWVN